MKRLSIVQWAVRLSAIVVLVGFCTSFGQSQNPDLKPTYGTINLEAGFEPDPVAVNVDAGGPVNTRVGGIAHWVANEPDLRVNYKAGQFSLTFYAECKEDSTLLINMPDGKTWLFNDDTNGLNPQIKITNPPSGQYDIWIGTLNKVGTPPARLFITELK